MPESIIEILMRRDGDTKDEARRRVKECREMVMNALDDEQGLTDIEEIIKDELGLEPDYLEELL
jgi:C4-type Zn-finger protein